MPRKPYDSRWPDSCSLAFNKANSMKQNAPFSSKISRQTIKNILNRSIRQSNRYLVMREQGASPDDIKRAFRTPVEMSLFTYHGEVDTVMTPIDSIRYYKSFLRSAFMSMDPHTGAVKAYVGGIDFEHFKYDMVMLGRQRWVLPSSLSSMPWPCKTA